MTCVLDSCNQGREPCPDPAVCCGRSRRVSDPDLLRQCLASGQADSRQIAAHYAAGELDGIGNECALPIIVDDIKPAPLFPPIGKRKPLPPTDWPAVARWGAAVALCVAWTVLVIYAR